jgi:hypothetical protein
MFQILIPSINITFKEYILLSWMQKRTTTFPTNSD